VFSTVGLTELVAWDAPGEIGRRQGIAFLSLGVVLAAVGVPLFVANQTHVDISEHSIGPVVGSSGVKLTPGGLVF
jgi:hypothetical protein